MKFRRPIIVSALALLAVSLVGCGPSKEELAERERARLELERQAQADAAKANKAITDMNKKMFKQMNASRTGAKTQDTTPTQPAPAAKSEPAKP